MTGDNVGMLFELLDGLVTSPRDVRTLAAGEALFHAGAPATHLFTVRAGLVRLQRCTSDGREVLMHRAFAGQTLCEAALTADQYHCDAVAVEPSTVGLVSKAAVLERLRADGDFAVALAATLAGELRRTRARLELRNVKLARERIVGHLLAHADERGEFRVAVTLKELASEIGIAHESLYRELAALETEGVLARDGKTIRILAGV